LIDAAHVWFFQEEASPRAGEGKGRRQFLLPSGEGADRRMRERPIQV
jgi:hypothetical protein